MKSAITQLLQLALQAWEEQNHAFYKGTNESIAPHLAYDANRSLYSQQHHTTDKRDSHLFYQPFLLELVLKARIGKKQVY